MTNNSRNEESRKVLQSEKKIFDNHSGLLRGLYSAKKISLGEILLFISMIFKENLTDELWCWTLSQISNLSIFKSNLTIYNRWDKLILLIAGQIIIQVFIIMLNKK